VTLNKNVFYFWSFFPKLGIKRLEETRRVQLEVLIACLSNTGIIDVIGTGLLLHSGGEDYVVTCRHVVDKHLNNLQVLSIPRCKRYVIPRDVDKECIPLTRPTYHPLDKTNSFDVAVFKVSELKLDERVKPYNLSLNQKVDLEIGSELTFAGFPTEYLHQEHDKFNELSLPPLKFNGVMGKAPLEKLEQSNFALPTIGIEFATRLTSNVKTSGLSGGAVYQQSQLVGLIIGSVNATLTNTMNGSVTSVNGIAFIPIVRIIETIEYEQSLLV
tara:strand:- start:284 stop:1096 length:813 start_codon:yes stop_codon:yes gene_type:complete